MQRILSIDIAKGITILLVIVAHAIPQERGGVREIIYSFHMPLFFILSAYVSKYSSNITEMWHRAVQIVKKLVPPTLLLWLVYAINSYVRDIDNYLSVSDFVVQKLLQLLYASGVNNSQLVILGGGNVEALGMPWFFAVLIESKIIYDVLQVYCKKHVLFIVVLLLTSAGVFLGEIYHFPLCGDVSIAVLFFLWVGHQMKDCRVSFDKVGFAVAFVSWGMLWFVTSRYAGWGLELAGRSYPMFPLCYIEALSGTLVIIYLSDIISKSNNFLLLQLSLWGSCSLNILMIHCVDFLWKDLYMVSDYLWVNVALRVVIDITLFYVYRTIKTKYIR